MAKEAQEIVLNEEQKEVVAKLNPELSAEYMQVVAIVTKLRKVGGRLTINEANMLLNFYEGDHFSEEQKETIALDEKQFARLVASVGKIGYPDYAARVATQTQLTHTTNKTLTKMIKKDGSVSLDYAKFYYNQHKGHSEKLDWCINMVLDPVKKDLKTGNPKDESLSRIAEFIYATTEAKMNDDGSLDFNGYNRAIMQFADKLFGTDDELLARASVIAQKKLKMVIRKGPDGKVLPEDFEKIKPFIVEEMKAKYKFIADVKKSIEEQHDIHQVAKVDAAEQEEFLSKIDNETKQYILARADELFNEKFKKELDANQAAMDDIKRRHPYDYEEYLNKLRKTKTYKEAFAKSSKKYSEARTECQGQAITEVKTAMNTHARDEVLGDEDKPVPAEEEVEAK